MMNTKFEIAKANTVVKRVPLLEALRILEFNINVSTDTKEWPEAGKDLIMLSSKEFCLLEDTFELFKALDDPVGSVLFPKADVYASMWNQMEDSIEGNIMPVPDGPEHGLRGKLIKWLLSFVIYMHEGWAIIKARYYLPNEVVNKYDVIGKYLIYFSEMVVFNLPKTGITKEVIALHWGNLLGPTYNVIMDLLVHVASWSFEDKPVTTTRVVFSHIWDMLLSIIQQNQERLRSIHVWSSSIYKYMTYDPFEANPLDDAMTVIRKI